MSLVGTSRSSNGTFTEWLIVPENGYDTIALLTGASGFNGTISGFSVQQVGDVPIQFTPFRKLTRSSSFTT